MQKSIIHALPLIASALGRKFGVKVEIGGERAFTDGKAIHIPALPLESDENTLNLARGYLDHEAAHLRVTDFEIVRKSGLAGIERHVWNILEDFMVERKLAAIYPGCRENFNWLAKHLFLSSASDATPTQALVNWLLISVRSFAVPELGTAKDTLEITMRSAFPGLIEGLRPLVNSVPQKCNDTQSCISMAKEIVEHIQDYVDKYPEPEQPPKEAHSSDDNAAQEQSEQGETEQENAGENQHDCAASCDSMDHAESEDEALADNSHASGNGDAQASEDDKQSLKETLLDPSAITDSDIGSLVGQMLESIGKGCSSSQLEIAMPINTVNQPLTVSEIADIRAKTSALRTRLTGLLQSKVLCRNNPGRSGRIDTRRISRLAVCDPKVFARRSERQGMNTLVHILLDASGSMQIGNKIDLACQACYATAEALHKIPGVSVAVTSFPNGACFGSDNSIPSWNTVCPVLTHNQTFHNHFQVRANGSTPMAPALWWVLQRMQEQPERRKILLILSDGDPDNLEEALEALEAHRAVGHEVYGIGIETLAIKSLVPDGKGRAIFDLSELPKVMFEMLKNAMIKGE